MATKTATLTLETDHVRFSVQTGGGVRSVEAARALFDLGVTRVVVGTAAMTEADLVPAVSQLGRVAVGLDVRGREVAVRGWTEGSGVQVLDAVRRFEGPDAVVDAFEIGRAHV